MSDASEMGAAPLTRLYTSTNEPNTKDFSRTASRVNAMTLTRRVGTVAVVLSCCIFLLSTSYQVKAADAVWTGGTGDWNLGTNWEPNVVPNNGTTKFAGGPDSFAIGVPAGTRGLSAFFRQHLDRRLPPCHALGHGQTRGLR